MGHRLSKIYTRTGDDGTTGLGDGSRVDKDGARITAIGQVDELNSAIGVLIAELHTGDEIACCLRRVQNELFDLGGGFSIPGARVLDGKQVAALETDLDKINATLPPLKNFVLPGGNRGAAAAHMARTICRRAERCVVRLSHEAPVNPVDLHYLNRLSDLCFVIARQLARKDGGEVLWQQRKPDP